MDNIIELRRKGSAPPITPPSPNDQAEGLGASDKPTHGGYPSVMATVASQVVKTLAFYALQGNDGGDLARKALRGMGFVVEQSLPGRGVLQTVA
jgi:hypothetical protein